MSNLPPGTRTTPTVLQFLCSQCDTVSEIRAIEELGTVEPTEKVVCPNCDNDDEEMIEQIF